MNPELVAKRRKSEVSGGDGRGALEGREIASSDGWDSSDYNIFFSSSVRGDLSKILGSTHYSYRFAEKKFLDMFLAKGVEPIPLEMPEFYASPEALIDKVVDVERLNVHFIFRSTEDMRLLKFGYNICCFAWEFDDLRDYTGYEEHPFRNQVRMLSLCQEVWVPSAFTEKVLRRYHLKNVRRIPAPVEPPRDMSFSFNGAMALLCRIPVVPLSLNGVTPRRARPAAARDSMISLLDWVIERRQAQERQDVFLCMINPQDHRKNVDSCLRAFAYFVSANPNALIVIKLITASTRVPLEEAATNLLFEELQGGTYLQSRQVVFISEYLSQAQLAALYSIADFYVSPSLAEGQNLPLQEAMSMGAVAISGCHTAMSDYISKRNAIVLRSSRAAAEDPGLAGHVSGRRLSVDRITVADLLDGLKRASSLSDTDRRRLSLAGRETIAQLFSQSATWPRVQAALNTYRHSRTSLARVSQ